MQSIQRMEQILRNALKPIYPRAEYVQALKRRLLLGQKMKVEMEEDRSVGDTITIATVGLGALATVAALTTLGVQIFQRTSVRQAQRSLHSDKNYRGGISAG
jgi:hypothetical protein